MIFNNGRVVEFEYPINERKTLIMDFVIIVILETPSKSKYNNNVFAISDIGNFLWQIDIEEPYIKDHNCPFVEARIDDSEKLLLFNWCNTAFIVEPITGAIINKFLTQ
jgi:hypothetical protein